MRMSVSFFQFYALSPLFFWMAFDAAVPQADNPNPMGLMISEVHTSALTGAGLIFPEFLEVYSKITGIAISTQNYYVVVAEQTGVRPDTLQITQLMDLGKRQMAQGSQYGIVQTANGGTDSLVAPFPNAAWRTFVKTDLNDWLRVKEKKFIAIFLVYSEDKIIPDVLPPGKKLLIKDELLDTLKKKSVDYVAITKHNGPSSCKRIDDIVKWSRQSKAIDILDLFLEEHNRVDAHYLYSVSRCASDKPFDLRSFKHSEPTPHGPNDCSGK